MKSNNAGEAIEGQTAIPVRSAAPTREIVARWLSNKGQLLEQSHYLTLAATPLRIHPGRPSRRSPNRKRRNADQHHRYRSEGEHVEPVASL